MSQLEAFATFRKPLVQVANLSVVASAQSVLFNFNPGTRSGTTVLSSAVITVANTQELQVGMGVSGTGVPAGSIILSIVPNTSITISQVATAAGAVTLSFSSIGGSQIVRIRISNVSANPVSLTLSGADVTSVPAVNTNTSGTVGVGTYATTTMACGTSSTVVAGDGIRIQGNSVLEINVSVDTRLWFIGTATAAALNIVAIMQNG